MVSFRGHCQALTTIFCHRGMCVWMCSVDVAMKGFCEHDGNSHGAAPVH